MWLKGEIGKFLFEKGEIGYVGYFWKLQKGEIPHNNAISESFNR